VPLPTTKAETAALPSGRRGEEERAVEWAVAMIATALDCGIPERLVRGVLQPEPLEAMIDCAKRQLRDEYAALGKDPQ
jgi:hypothetical protein